MRTAIATARLRLDTFVPSDGSELHDIFADPATNTVGSGPFTSIEQTEQWIRNRVSAERDHGLCWYAVRDAESNRLIGNCGMLKGRTGYIEPEIGYMISKDRQGRGFASEAAAAVIDECRHAGIARVWSSIRPHNTASCRIVERLGFRVDRTDVDERGDLRFYVIDLDEDRSRPNAE
jgi:ribosomal-protein-alanine N-acetyltransferase